MDSEFKYNKERYYDPTAYIALSKVQKGEKMNMDSRSRVGEIWEYCLPSRNDMMLGLILADDGNVVTFLRLIEIKNDKHDIEVVCRGKMYACSRMISYMFSQSLVSFERTVPDKDFQEILDKIADSLGCGASIATPVPVSYVNHVEAEPDMELERTKAQLEVYKGLYESLLQKMVG